MIIRNLVTDRLTIDRFETKNGEKWCLYGTRSSGISEFLLLLEGEVILPEKDQLLLPKSPCIISFRRQQQLYENELEMDDSDYLDRPDPGTPAHQFLPPDRLDDPLIDTFGMRQAMPTGYRYLSSGQSRKILLLQALLGNNSTIVIDSPYDGLDQATCDELGQAFNTLQLKDQQLIFLVRNVGDIPPWCSHLGIFTDGSMIHSGPMDMVKPHIPDTTGNAYLFQHDGVEKHPEKQQDDIAGPLIRLSDGFAGYAGKTLFSGLDLTVDRGDHTLITGPNGCGKSTLMHIITGDNPKCYANTLYLFGIRRGTGESIWDLKHHMGIVSPEIHRSYRVPGSVLSVVLSGLFDSIGLYRQVSDLQKADAKRWLAAIELADMAHTPFRSLSYGDQRLVLIARALVKQPRLLILDEPTQGLDDTSRAALLDFLESLAVDNRTTILYVSHREDEYREFFCQHIELESYARL